MSGEADLSGASLIVSMFEDLRHGQRETETRLDEGNERMGRLEFTVGGLKMLQREQNGNVALQAQWQARHDARQHDVELSVQAAAAERARLVGHVEKVRQVISQWSAPALVVIGATMTVGNIVLAAFWWLR